MKSRYAEALTPREQEVIELLSTGRTNEEIARQLGISLDGVKYHVSGIFRRLRVRNRHEAASLHLGTEGGVLTPREREVIELLSTGLTNEEIARQLGISLAGVKYHVSGILRRLDVENRHEAASLRLRTESNGRLAAWAPVMFLRKLPFAWLPKAAAGAVLTTAAVGIGVLAWGVMATGLPASGVTAISAGGFGTCALKDGGDWCWGQLGAGEPEPGDTNGRLTERLVPVAVSGLASGVSAIDGFCAVKDGGAWCWVDNTLVPVAVPGLASGVSAISGPCALKNGGVWCWGHGGFGQLGNGSTANSDVAVAVSGLASGVSAISSGGNSTCALKDGGVWCWGLFGNGRLGNDRTGDSPVPVAVSALASGVSAISGGGGHYCALKDGGVWCWGYNRFGQLGQLGDDPNRDSAVDIGEPGNEGKDSPVPLAVSGLATGVSAISAGNHHTCALKHGGIWCWGENVAGGLGDGTDTGSLAPVAVLGLASGVSAISAGAYHTCALTDNGVWCWGMNDHGQLGNGTTTGPEVCGGAFACSTAPVPVMGLASGVSAEEPDSKPLPSQTSADSAHHQAAYVLAGTAAAALAIIAAGMWAVRRRRRSRSAADDIDVWRNPGA